MMMMSPPVFTVLFVAATVVIVSATTSPSLAQPPASIAMLEPTKLFRHTPPRDILPKIRCWSSITKVEGCAADLILSYKKWHVDVTGDCCDAVVSIGDECFLTVFTNSPFGPLFPPLLKAFCDAILSNIGRNNSKVSPPPPPPVA